MKNAPRQPNTETEVCATIHRGTGFSLCSLGKR